MALYDTRYGLPQSMVDYLNQGLPSIYQPPTVDPIDSQPIEDEEDQVLEELYPQNYQGGGDGYSVYNPDPNMTRTSAQYSPYAYNRAMRNTELGTVSPNPDMYYPKESGLANLLNFVPYIGSIKRGIEFFKDKIPISRTGILQNELLGGGFMLDNIGRIVSAPGKYNTPEGIMAGYNPVSGGLLNLVTGGEKGEPATYGLDKSYDKRRETIAKTLKEKYGMLDKDIQAAIAGEYTGETPVDERLNNRPTDLINRLNLLNQSQNLFNRRKEMADIVFNRKVEERQREKQRAAVQEAARKSAVAQEASNRNYARKKSSGPSYSGMSSIGSGGGGGKSAPSSGTGRGATSATSSGLGNLGFSDKRLKENIELIGKSPSNINIYKFNYKDNPTTYQGAMAHEVPWASVKHPSGYMMVDYNLIDIEFKKYNA